MRSKHSRRPPTASAWRLAPVPAVAALLLSATAPTAGAQAIAKGAIQHVIVVMMENRSFDHSLGWMSSPPAGTPTADGWTGGTQYEDTNNALQAIHSLAPDWQGCGQDDPGHSYAEARTQWVGTGTSAAPGIDGFLKTAPAGDVYPIGYYASGDLPFYDGLAKEWTTLDRYFPPMLAGTWANKIYQYAADTDRLGTGDVNPITTGACATNPNASAFPNTSNLETIFDLIAADGGLTVRYYFTDVPLVALWGERYVSITRHVSQFYIDAIAGQLPNVAFIDPAFLLEMNGTSRDDHPFADVRTGQYFMNTIYQAVIHSPDWPRTALIINHDEWGGFFDHVDPNAVAPTTAAACQNVVENDTTKNPAAGGQAAVEFGLRGFRVPAFVISPYAPRGAVDSNVYDHASILRMIEWNWNLPSLTTRDAPGTPNLASVFDATPALYPKPAFSVPIRAFSPPCPGIPPSGPDAWVALRNRAILYGFDVPGFALPVLSPGSAVLLVAALAAAGLALRRRRR